MKYFHATVMVLFDGNMEHKQELYHIELPENIDLKDTLTVEKMVRERLLERMEPMIKACATEELKESVRKLTMEAKLLNIEPENLKKVPLFV